MKATLRSETDTDSYCHTHTSAQASFAHLFSLSLFFPPHARTHTTTPTHARDTTKTPSAQMIRIAHRTREIMFLFAGKCIHSCVCDADARLYRTRLRLVTALTLASEDIVEKDLEKYDSRHSQTINWIFSLSFHSLSIALNYQIII